MPSFQPLWWSCWWLFSVFCIYFCWRSHCNGSFLSCTSSWRKTLFSLQTAWRDSFGNLFLLLVFESLLCCVIDCADRPHLCIINKIDMSNSLNCWSIGSYIGCIFGCISLLMPRQDLLAEMLLTKYPAGSKMNPAIRTHARTHFIYVRYTKLRSCENSAMNLLLTSLLVIMEGFAFWAVLSRFCLIKLIWLAIAFAHLTDMSVIGYKNCKNKCT